ncbi:MAG: hypothetical protein HOQ38_05860 [Nonomuraea sp.]|nr:hypothetical protein [Nonomuraea sp.]
MAPSAGPAHRLNFEVEDHDPEPRRHPRRDLRSLLADLENIPARRVA